MRLGGVEARVLHLGRAHTGGDSVVYFPDVKVVATSDAVTTGTGGPLVDYAGGGSAVGLAAGARRDAEARFRRRDPGRRSGAHEGRRAGLPGKFSTVVDRAAALVRAGVPTDQLLMQIKTDDIGWAPRIPQVDAFVAELSAGGAR